MLSTPFVRESRSDMTRGKGGQTSNASLGVFGVQKSRRLRRRGDAKTIVRHRRHTCTSDCHVSIIVFAYRGLPYAQKLYGDSGTLSSQQSNIPSRTSSGSTSIDITWPTWHQSVSNCRGMFDNGTYIDIGRLFSRQTSDIHHGMLDFHPSSSLPNENILVSMIQSV